MNGSIFIFVFEKYSGISINSITYDTQTYFFRYLLQIMMETNCLEIASLISVLQKYAKRIQNLSNCCRHKYYQSISRFFFDYRYLLQIMMEANCLEIAFLILMLQKRRPNFNDPTYWNNYI
jgi:hypothetical protein